MHVHDLPLPREVLEDLGSLQVRMRVTLSYLIEPNPPRRGYVARYPYASHGLRFSVRRPPETPERMIGRLSTTDWPRSEDGKKIRPFETIADDRVWDLGPEKVSVRGSIHSDAWNGTAAQLASSNLIAVYPVAGWWRYQWAKVRGVAKGPIVDFLDFLWSTGCRPQEARTLEARHLNDDLVIFAIVESKGEKYQRVLFLTAESQAIVKRLAAKYPTGPLFRNRLGRAWTKDSVKCVLTRISKRVGFRVIAYGARHGYATNALLNGIDAISVSHLMGHKSPSMVAEVYSHLAQNHDFLRKQAKNASPAPSATPTPPQVTTATNSL